METIPYHDNIQKTIIKKYEKGIITMRTIRTLDLKDAKKALQAMEKKAKEMSLNLCFCIVDSAANTIILERMDDSKLHSIDLSRAKAFTAISLKDSSGSAHKLVQDLGIDISYWAGGVETGWKGGVPAFAPEDKETPIGAIGVSGGTEDQDEQIAIEGLKAMSFYKENL